MESVRRLQHSASQALLGDVSNAAAAEMDTEDVLLSASLRLAAAGAAAATAAAAAGAEGDDDDDDDDDEGSGGVYSHATRFRST